MCSDDVEKGTVVLTDPPKMSCEDFDLASRYVGSGFSIGPDTTIEEVKAFLAKWVAQQELKKKQKFQEVSVPPKPETTPVVGQRQCHIPGSSVLALVPSGFDCTAGILHSPIAWLGDS